MTTATWQYNVNLNKDVGQIALSKIGTAPLEGSVIPVRFGENPRIELLRPSGEDWEFADIIFSTLGNATSTLAVSRSNPPAVLPTTLYDYTQSPIVFDVILIEIGTNRIVLSNANQVEESPLGSATIDFQVVLKSSNLVYISKDPQLRDEPGG